MKLITEHNGVIIYEWYKNNIYEYWVTDESQSVLLFSFGGEHPTYEHTLNLLIDNGYFNHELSIIEEI